MALTTFRRLTRQEEIRTTANVSTMPRQNAMTTFSGLVAKEISKPDPANALPITRTISHPTPTPATLPRALARRA
jgi:hypothetical protein